MYFILGPFALVSDDRMLTHGLGGAGTLFLGCSSTFWLQHLLEIRDHTHGSSSRITNNRAAEITLGMWFSAGNWPLGLTDLRLLKQALLPLSCSWESDFWGDVNLAALRFYSCSGATLRGCLGHDTIWGNKSRPFKPSLLPWNPDFTILNRDSIQDS